MTLALAGASVIVDGVERWKDDDAEAVAPLLAGDGDDLTVAFLRRARRGGSRSRALIKAVEAVGGDVRAETTSSPGSSRSGRRRAPPPELDLELSPGAAKASWPRGRAPAAPPARAREARPGPRARGRVEVEDVRRPGRAVGRAKAWTLADALVARDAPPPARLPRLRPRERLAGLLYVHGRRCATPTASSSASRRRGPGPVRRSLRCRPRRPNASWPRRSGRSARLREAIARHATSSTDPGRGEGMMAEDTAAVEAIARLTASPQ